MTCGCTAPTRYRWAGLTWIGLPAPFRAWAAIRHWWAGGTSDWATVYAAFPGCGCVEPWRLLVDRACAKLSHNAQTATHQE